MGTLGQSGIAQDSGNRAVAEVSSKLVHVLKSAERNGAHAMMNKSFDFFNENVQPNVPFLSVLSVMGIKPSTCNHSFSASEYQSFRW